MSIIALREWSVSHSAEAADVPGWLLAVAVGITGIVFYLVITLLRWGWRPVRS